MRLALYQPDIPQNTGAVMRLAACFKVPVDIIEPCGFPFDDKRLRRTVMDYGAACEVRRHASWDAYLAGFSQIPSGRLVLLSTAATVTFTDFAFAAGDTLLLGRETRGVPETVRGAANAHIRIPIAENMRSLNVVVAAAIGLTEALRQQGAFRDGTAC